jgi:hypothetical protein
MAKMMLAIGKSQPRRRFLIRRDDDSLSKDYHGDAMTIRES